MKPPHLTTVGIALFGLACLGGHAIPPAGSRGDLTTLYGPPDTIHIQLVSARLLFTAARSGLFDETRFVVRDSSTWVAVWARLGTEDIKQRPGTTASDDPPAVDFSREMVIVLGRGRTECLFAAPVLDRFFFDPTRGDLFAVVRTPQLPDGAGCLPEFGAAVSVYRTGWSTHPVRFSEAR